MHWLEDMGRIVLDVIVFASVQAFWSVVQSELSPEERRLLLLFITGTDRLPEAGCETLSIEASDFKEGFLHQFSRSSTVLPVLQYTFVIVILTLQRGNICVCLLASQSRVLMKGRL